MIFYFSGTGNTRYVALSLARKLGTTALMITDAMAHGDESYALSSGESVGMVFPTHCWGPPPIFLRFMERLKIAGVNADTYCYMVTTCGDDTGMTVELWRKSLPAGLTGKAAFSVQMPNTYIVLPGFDVDNKLLERFKIVRSKRRIEEIAAHIMAREEIVDVVRGSWPRLKSGIVRSWFLKHAMSDRPFTVDSRLCTACGLCVGACPVHNLTADEHGCPVWHGNCTMCLSCIHRCPARAIEYGRRTRKKGRYHFPGPAELTKLNTSF